MANGLQLENGVDTNAWSGAKEKRLGLSLQVEFGLTVVQDGLFDVAGEGAGKGHKHGVGPKEGQSTVGWKEWREEGDEAVLREELQANTELHAQRIGTGVYRWEVT